MANEAQKIKHLNEHLPYELSMLRHSFGRLCTTKDKRDWCSFLECFCIHARILKEFLNNRAEAGNLEAGDYDEGFRWPLPRELHGAFQKIGPQVTHLSQGRPTGATDSKLTFGEVKDIYGWVEPSMCAFISRLNPRDRGYWNEQEAPSASQSSRYDSFVLPFNSTTSTLAGSVFVSSTFDRNK